MSYLKGAPEMLLGRCALSTEDRESWVEKADAYAREGFRVLAVAWAEGETEEHLSLLGLVLFWDPPRPEVPDAVAKAQAAGIRVVMITGDHPATALAVAHLIGIPGVRVLTGEDLDEYQGAALIEALGEVNVFARVRPEQKLQLVEMLQAQGQIVAMTGDGVNDAPALKRSDVGVAMGQRGSDVSREVADLVLLDDNFATIVGAVEEGRGIYENIQKFLRFLFSTNLSEVLLVAGGAVLAFALDLRDATGALMLPLTAAQILWINLLTDGVPALALAFDRTPGVMQQPPRPANAPLLDRPSVRFVVAAGSMKAVLALGGPRPRAVVRLLSGCRASGRVPLHGRRPIAPDLPVQTHVDAPASQRVSACRGHRWRRHPGRRGFAAAYLGSPRERRHSRGAVGRRVRRRAAGVGTCGGVFPTRLAPACAREPANDDLDSVSGHGACHRLRGRASRPVRGRARGKDRPGTQLGRRGALGGDHEPARAVHRLRRDGAGRAPRHRRRGRAGQLHVQPADPLVHGRRPARAAQHARPPGSRALHRVRPGARRHRRSRSAGRFSAPTVRMDRPVYAGAHRSVLREHAAHLHPRTASAGTRGPGGGRGTAICRDPTAHRGPALHGAAVLVVGAALLAASAWRGTGAPDRTG